MSIDAKSLLYLPRQCSLFYCHTVREPRCCADCDRKGKKCHNPCKNDPSRCNLEATGRDKKPARPHRKTQTAGAGYAGAADRGHDFQGPRQL